MSRRFLTPYIKKIAIAALIIILLIILRGRILAVISTFQSGNIVSSLKDELAAKKKENAYLREKLIIAKTDVFVEEEARTKLGMVREGEKIVADRKIEPKKIEIEKTQPPNWQKWKDLFF